MKIHEFETIQHEAALCVVGGGMAGLIAAISAARRGVKTILMHDRSVLGGNASSEIRMWICGARGADNKETGLLEEIQLANIHRNPNLTYPIWDTILYEKARFQENLTLLLNTACSQVNCTGDIIQSVRGWQSTTQQWHTVSARYFADCSGDSVLRVSGAEFRRGRESRAEYQESLAPEQADDRTMGNSILIQSRQTGRNQPFIPPSWAYRLTEADLPNRNLIPTGENFWWMEIGGMQDTLRDSEAIRDELLKIAYGVWALIKNHPDGRGNGWEIDWIGSLPGKRENIRYLGEHTLTQNDILDGGHFEDVVAHGGWPMDDHHPGGIRYHGPATVFHYTPSPYGIPLRCLYSRNIANLFFAGRNISASHMAMSSTRVMATCAVLGQAVGTAAALAVRESCSPHELYAHHLPDLQAALQDDDCYLPGRKRPISSVSLQAELSTSFGNCEGLRSGVDRVLGGLDQGWWAPPGEWSEYRFPQPVHLKRARLVLDSDLTQTKRMPCWIPAEGNLASLPGMLLREFELTALDSSGNWQILTTVEENCQRLIKIPMDVETRAIRLIPRRTWGGEQAHVMAFEVEA